MKKNGWISRNFGLLLLLLVFGLALASCKRETPVGETPVDPGAGNGAGETPGGEDTDDPQGGEDGSQAEESEVTLYLPNETADAFLTSSMILKDTPQDIINELSSQGALPEGIRVLGFDEGKGALDLSQEFLDALSTSGTAGEWLLIGSVVNTFLEHYGLEELTVTCEGETMETGHTVYDSPLSYFEY